MDRVYFMKQTLIKKGKARESTRLYYNGYLQYHTRFKNIVQDSDIK